MILILKKLKLNGWRNYTGEEGIFSPGINLFLGSNGQGKTNLLEAIYFLSCGQTPRTGKLEDLIKWDSNYFFLKGEYCSAEKELTVEMGGARDGRRLSKVNGSPVLRLSEISEHINAVFFMPDDLYLVKGDPSKRRRFMDMEIAQLSSQYRYQLLEYRKYLRERNALLKAKVKDRILMEVLTEKIASLTGPIAQARQGFLQKISILARLKHRKLSGNREELSLKYEASVEPGLTTEEVMGLFSKAMELDERYRTTTIGPHRDDFSFIVNGSNLKVFGSQGQQRTAVLSLKLAEIELVKAETGRFPLLLLDDVFSELDDQRKKMLLDYLSDKIQTFISSAELLPTQVRAAEFWIQEGSIRERK